MDNYNDYVNDYMNSYNCPDCDEAKLQSDKNARKINEVIDQVNTLIQVNNETVDFIEEKVNEVLGDLGPEIDLTDYATKTELSSKVDKVDGKGLSTNDYTTAEKNKLSGLTNYTHPNSHSATMIKEDSTHRFVTDSEKSSWDNKSNLALGTTSTTAFRGDYGNTAYNHSQSTHAPSNAQKNSDITKAEIEAKLTGNITSHTHSQYITNGTLVPDYWVSELESKANDIQIAMEQAGRNKSAFLWYTDAHWVNGNSKKSPILLNYLCKNTPMNKVNFGGDIIGDTLLNTRDEMKYLYEWRKMVKDLPNHHSVLGNHDMMSITNNNFNDDNYRYAFMLASEETPNIVWGDGNYYYIDNPSEKTRYLYIAYMTSDLNAMLKQGQFICDSIKAVPEGWHIVAITHRWWQYNSSSNPTTGSIPAYETEILDVFDKYNARATRSGSNYFTTQNFTSGKGKVEFCIGGHIHVDYDIFSNGGIPIIITTADVNQNRVPTTEIDSGTVGTITESAVYGIIADYNEEVTKITVVGVGRGTSRVISGKEKQAENLFNKNDSDVVLTGRFNSSKNAVEHQQGQLVTGFIKAQIGDTFTIESDKSQITNSYTGTVMLYNASKTAITPIINQAIADGGWTWASDNLNGTITITSSYSNVSHEGTTFVRFCIAYTNIDSIVITKS